MANLEFLQVDTSQHEIAVEILLTEVGEQGRAGADPALNLTGAQTGNGQEIADTVFGTSGGGLGALRAPPEAQGCSML